MDEDAWMNGADPEVLLDYIRPSASDRKLRLFTLECCCRIWNNIDVQSHRDALLFLEQVANGVVSAEALVERARILLADSATAFTASSVIAQGAMLADAFTAARETAWRTGRWSGNEIAGLAATANLVREVFGNPFRPLAIDPAWRTPDVQQIATVAYERRRPDGTFDPFGLVLLADALEEAGATGSELLGHLRSAGPHVRGCQALDAVLARK